jgi:hypothetical protein
MNGSYVICDVNFVGSSSSSNSITTSYVTTKSFYQSAIYVVPVSTSGIGQLSISSLIPSST